MLFNTLLLALAGVANAVLPIVASGNKFYLVNEDYTKKGTEFKVVGVDYQPGGSSAFQVNGDSDVLSDGESCLRDAYVLQQLGVNTIRVYSVSPWLNHDECMTIFNNAGIYVILDLNNPYQSLHRTNTGDSYNSDLLNNVFGLIDAFKYYPNVLGFFSGNEIVNDGPSAESAPKYIRALQRDIKSYIDKHANRTIPVGYSAADDLTLRQAMWEYLQCGDDSSKSDFYGLNSYQWCSGSSDWESSGYAGVRSTFANSSIPVFFSEYGCNKNSPRTFDEVTDGVYKQGDDGLYDVIAGGLIYEYSEETSNYGLVDIDSDGDVKYLTDFDNLKGRFAKIQLLNETQTSDPNQAPKCDKSLISGLSTDFDWQTDDLPDCPDQDLLNNGGGNKNIGKLIDISKLSQKYKITDTSGDEQDGKINWVGTGANWQFNVPAKNSTTTVTSAAPSSSASSTAAASTSAAASSSKKKNAAVGPVGVSWLSAAASLLLCLF